MNFEVGVMGVLSVIPYPNNVEDTLITWLSTAATTVVDKKLNQPNSDPPLFSPFLAFQVVLKRLYMSRVNRPPMSVARVARMMKKPGK